VPVVAYTVEPPHRKWVISMEQVRVSELSLETLRFPVFADSGGAIHNPTGAVVELAFIPEAATNPAGGDWTAGGWDSTVIGTYVATFLVGPGGAKALAPGTYYVWIRITEAPEAVVREVGELVVD
jgi:hypothetical protein